MIGCFLFSIERSDPQTLVLSSGVLDFVDGKVEVLSEEERQLETISSSLILHQIGQK